jgi:hypothetical protein
MLTLPACSDLLLTSEVTNRTARLHLTNYNEEVSGTLRVIMYIYSTIPPAAAAVLHDTNHADGVATVCIKKIPCALRRHHLTVHVHTLHADGLA